MNEDPKPLPCIFCGGDCSFLATCDRCCLGCGDAMQQQIRDNLFKFIQAVVNALVELHALRGSAPQADTPTIVSDKPAP